MKKKIMCIFTIICDAFLATFGALAAIGFMELITVIISICIGEYVRLDEGNLSLIIEDYIVIGILGYGMGYGWIICNKVGTDDKKDPIQKTRSIINSFWIIVTILISIYAIVISDFRGTLMMLLISLILFGGALILLNLWDRIIIKEINKKIKENQNKED